MARNCKLRCAAQTQYHIEERGLAHGAEYPTSKSGKLVTSTKSSRRNSLLGHHFRESAFSTSEQEKHCYSRLAAALVTLAMGGAVLASNLTELEKLYSRLENGANALFLPNPTRVPYVEITSLAAVDLRNYGPRKGTAQSSPEVGSSSIHHRLNVEKLVATPVPAYLIETTSDIRPSDTKTAFAPKGELAHEYWRAMIGASHVMERYQLYLGNHPSGVVADTAVDRIREMEQVAEKATRTKMRQRVAKAKKRQNTSKQTKPDIVQTSVALSTKETNAVQCGGQNGFKCRKPLQTLAKNCSSSTGLSPEGVCVRRNYRTSTIVKR
jgi:hypothetical protein